MTAFRRDTVHDVAVLTLDCEGEPVNTLGPAVAAEFDALLSSVARDPGVRAVVLASGKPDSFITGADIRHLATLRTAEDAAQASRQAQGAFNRLEVLGKPVVAAIHGACLGGGLELALACSYRLISDSPRSTVGLPEVQLGLIPGAGGTQRLPALIGVQAALDLILTGKTVKAKKAVKSGICDEIVPEALLRALAIERAQALASGTLTPQRTRGTAFHAPLKARGLKGVFQGVSSKERWAELALEENPLGRKLLFDQARKKLLAKTRGKYPAPERALDVIRAGLEQGRQAGLEREAEAFGGLVTSDVSKRLVEVFFATQALKKDNGTSNPGIRARPVEKVGVLGGGLMGSGIAWVSAAKAGLHIRLKERDDKAAGHALKSVARLADERVRRKSLSAREAAAILARVSVTTTDTGFRQAPLVIEAVFEDLALKQACLKAVEAAGPKGVIFASNTSSIPIARIAEAAAHPENVIGMHYFSPVHKMPLVEIVTHPGTADDVTATCVEVARKQGKTVIVVRDGPGFYTTRILGIFLNEAAHLLLEGASVEHLDGALVEFGFPVGPLTLLDEVGIDVGARVASVLHQGLGARFEPPALTASLVAEGRLGRKNKKGFYTYDGKDKRVDTTVYAHLPRGAARVNLDRHDMAERCVLALVNEAVRCLETGILRSPRDGDIGALFGLGFPPFLGGPFRYAEHVGLGRVLERLEFLEKRVGPRFAPAPLLRQAVQEGRKSFYVPV